MIYICKTFVLKYLYFSFIDFCFIFNSTLYLILTENVTSQESVLGTCRNDCPGVRGIEVGIGFGIVASALGIAGW